MKKKIVLITGLALMVLFVVWSILVRTVDVAKVTVSSPNNADSIVGFSTMNKAFFEFTKEHMSLYKATNVVGYLPYLAVAFFAAIGIIQWIKRKNILKVDKSIITLGIFYILVLSLYFIFEALKINYRPIWIGDSLEVSYPSSHTFVCLFITATGIIMNHVNKSIFGDRKLIKWIVDGVYAVLGIFILVGRTFSGTHWLSDIIGGLLLSASLILIFYFFALFFEEKKVESSAE